MMGKHTRPETPDIESLNTSYIPKMEDRVRSPLLVGEWIVSGTPGNGWIELSMPTKRNTRYVIKTLRYYVFKVGENDESARLDQSRS